jgi:hypothetical protein
VCLLSFAAPMQRESRGGGLSRGRRWKGGCVQTNHPDCGERESGRGGLTHGRLVARVRWGPRTLTPNTRTLMDGSFTAAKMGSSKSSYAQQPAVPSPYHPRHTHKSCEQQEGGNLISLMNSQSDATSLELCVDLTTRAVTRHEGRGR